MLYHEDARNKLVLCTEQANFKLQTNLPQPRLSFHLRGRAAGKAQLTIWAIQLNPTLLAENGQAFIDQVIPHEMAHLVVYYLYGAVRPHGKEWQYIMRTVFNVPPITTHNFALKSVIGQTFLYRCGCQDHQLTIRRHNKVQRGKTQYHCTNCKQKLYLAY